MSRLPKEVSIVEVGPRDGLQNEHAKIELDDKVDLINRLSETGLKKIETGSFVSPKWVPQMANSAEVFAKIERRADITYSALTPNMRGLEAAIDAGVNEVAIFGAASESFSQKNINCSIAESIKRFEPVVDIALANGIDVRAYVSCVVGCPYEGKIDAVAVKNVCKRLLELGCYEVSLGDTIGVGTPEQIKHLIQSLKTDIAPEQLAIHCHDTYGQGIANIYAALQCGVTTIDSSIAGLGGCPYAAGASGNVATEDVVYLMNGLGIASGVDLQALVDAGNFISEQLGRGNQSKVARAISSKLESNAPTT